MILKNFIFASTLTHFELTYSEILLLLTYTSIFEEMMQIDFLLAFEHTLSSLCTDISSHYILSP